MADSASVLGVTEGGKVIFTSGQLMRSVRRSFFALSAPAFAPHRLLSAPALRPCPPSLHSGRSSRLAPSHHRVPQAHCPCLSRLLHPFSSSRPSACCRPSLPLCAAHCHRPTAKRRAAHTAAFFVVACATFTRLFFRPPFSFCLLLLAGVLGRSAGAVARGPARPPVLHSPPAPSTLLCRCTGPCR